ncbi:hypothetical protein, partial [Gelidibacter salicanalis]
MKTVGKAIKLSDQTPRGMEQALELALADYRDTPHVITGLTPNAATKLNLQAQIDKLKETDWDS